MGRGRAQASVAEGVTEAVVFSILLFLALLIYRRYIPWLRYPLWGRQ
jgi:hypothetical protein